MPVVLYDQTFDGVPIGTSPPDSLTENVGLGCSVQVRADGLGRCVLLNAGGGFQTKAGGFTGQTEQSVSIFFQMFAPDTPGGQILAVNSTDPVADTGVQLIALVINQDSTIMAQFPGVPLKDQGSTVIPLEQNTWTFIQADFTFSDSNGLLACSVTLTVNGVTYLLGYQKTTGIAISNLPVHFCNQYVFTAACIHGSFVDNITITDGSTINDFPHPGTPLKARVSQLVYEPAIDEGTIETFARVSQLAVETIGKPIPSARVSQLVIELLATKISPPLGGAGIHVYES